MQKNLICCVQMPLNHTVMEDEAQVKYPLPNNTFLSETNKKRPSEKARPICETMLTRQSGCFFRFPGLLQ